MIVTANKTAFIEDKHLVLFKKINPFVGIDCLIQQVKEEKIFLYEVTADDLLLGIFLARIETLLNGDLEFVVIHASSIIKPPVPLTSILNPIFDKIANDNRIKSIRVHSDKKGLDHLLEENNYSFLESIYRKELNVKR